MNKIVHSSDSIYRYYRQMTKTSFKSVPGEKTELAPGLPAESLQPATQPLRTLLIFTAVANEGKVPEFLPFFSKSLLSLDLLDILNYPMVELV